MIIQLILIALAPAIMLLFYVNYRDKYDKEPAWLLILCVIAGAFTVIPILFIENLLSLPASWMRGYLNAGWNAFVVAAFTEELFKYIAVMLIVWRSRHFNEQFDGIVYAVFVSMGFAMVENVLYVMNGGLGVAFMRALTAVPAHAIFGISMGYYIGRARFNKEKRNVFLLIAIAMPIFLHGLYDFILMSQMPFFLLFFVVYMYVLYRQGLRRMRQLSNDSRFNPNNSRYYRNVDDPVYNTKESKNEEAETTNTQEHRDFKENDRGFDI
jgi:protease PrsW